MSVAKLKGLDSYEALDLRAFHPAGAFCIYLNAEVGPHDSEGGAVFRFRLCNPQWLQEEAERRGGGLLARHTLVVSEYDYDVVVRVIEKMLQGAGFDTWQNLARRIARFGHWEFEDYTPSEEP